MNQTEFDMIRAAIKAAWPGYMVMNDKYSIRFWYSMLGHLNFKVAENAVQQLAATSKYPPQISDILQKAAEMDGDVIDDPGVAWQLVMKAVRNYGSYRPKEAKESLPPIVRDAVEQIGYMELCTSDNITADRAHFFRVYETLRERTMNARKMPPAVAPSERRLGLGNTRHDNLLGQHSENAPAGILDSDSASLAPDITRDETDKTNQKIHKDIEDLRRRLLYGKESGGKAGEGHGD